MPQLFVLWELYEEVPGSILGRSDLGINFSKLVLIKVFGGGYTG